MKSVLISIQPYWVFLIIARLMGWDIPQEKTIEVRKDFPKDSAWNKKVHIYCSKNRKSFKRIPKQYQPIMKKLLGKVIGKFVCDRIDEFHEWRLTPQGKYQEFEETDLKKFLSESCLSWEEVYAYCKNLPYYKPLYAWHISDLKIYDKPKELGEFITVCKTYYSDNDDKCWGCPNLRVIDGNKEAYQGDCISRHKPLTRPPQSWCYVEGE